MTLDDSVFDRLADDELSGDERRSLLAALDHREGAWRQCALALLESQAWKREFRGMLADEAPETRFVKDANHPRKHWNRRSGLLVAASVVLGIALGGVIRYSNDSQVATYDRSIVDTQSQLETDLDRITLVVRDSSGQDQRLSLPLIGAEAVNEQFGRIPPHRLPSVVDRGFLREQGWDVQIRRRYAPLFFEQDEQLIPMVIPVEDNYFMPVEQTVF